MAQQQAFERKASLKNELEKNFRDMVNRYLGHDAKQMISEHQIIFAKQNGTAQGAQMSLKEQEHESAKRVQEEIDNLPAYQKKLVTNTPRMRSLDNRDEKDRLY